MSKHKLGIEITESAHKKYNSLPAGINKGQYVCAQEGYADDLLFVELIHSSALDRCKAIILTIKESEKE
jgi:hypothetical protein